jgi:DNA-binding beta-propeller fold protein YncE/ABC-type Fe3+ transport system permease subunit
MRGSACAVLSFVLLAWLACVGWPALAAIEQLFQLTRTEVDTHSLGSLLVTSVMWSIAVAVSAMIVGWIPGRVLGKALSGPCAGFIPLAVLTLAPICLPSYIVFYAWWQSWPADSALHKWVVANHHMQLARQATLFLGLACWSWPLVSWSVAGVAAAMPAQREELLILDGAGPLRRLAHQFRNDGRGLMLGGLFVFLATVANTTCFDLAEVFTFANELRAMQALGGNAKDVTIAALPAMAISALGAVVVWRLLSAHRRAREAPSRVRQTSAWSAAVFSAIWTCSVVLPLGMFGWSLLSSSDVLQATGEFFALYRWSIGNTMLYASISGLLGALIAVGLATAWMTERRWLRAIANTSAITWITTALLPGTVIGVAIQAAYDRMIFREADIPHKHTPGILQQFVMLQPTVYIIAHLACFGFVAVLMARWTAMHEPSQLRELRRLDGANSMLGLIETNRPRLLAAGWATFAIIFVLALGEIPVTAVVNPPHRPGAGPLALTLLNDMHYQRPQTVMMASFLLMAASIGAAMIVAFFWISRTRQIAAFQRSIKLFCVFVCVLCVSVLNTGCTPDDPEKPAPLNPQLTFGRAGTALGQFAYPRAIDVDAKNEYLFIIDKQARVQRFGFDGKPQVQWQMPESENGKPTGVSVGPDGRIYVADTHYFRVIVYDADGKEQLRLGEFGRGPRQFIYITDIAFGPNGNLYVSEYGGNDRVQVFDASGNYLFEFASLGEHGKLNRPQSLVFNSDKSELYIADACNHRIVVVDVNGKFLREFGSAGRGLGQLTYPYGLTVLRDGSILVAEFGNNRLQRFDVAGKPLGIFGSIGRGPGQLQYPWGVAATRDRVFVLDSGNNRVQVIRNP